MKIEQPFHTLAELPQAEIWGHMTILTPEVAIPTNLNWKSQELFLRAELSLQQPLSTTQKFNLVQSEFMFSLEIFFQVIHQALYRHKPVEF